MKKIVFLTLFLFFVLATSKADQLAYLTKEQAKTATAFLKKQAEVLIWCACCDNDPIQVVKVTKVRFKSVKYKQYYQISLKGVDKSGKTRKEELDLAYVFINKNGKAYCVGKELGYKCDPCTGVFEWGER
jgi:hypothetical protein